MAKYSIIIPIYNVENYLEKSINSALNQTFDDYEIVLVDDGSTDSSSKIAKSFAEKYPEKVIYVWQENKGLGGARNTGIKASKGEYLMFLDSDDMVSEEMLFEVDQKIIETNAQMVIFDLLKEDENGNQIEIVKGANYNKDSFTLDEYKEMIFTPVSACNKVIKKSLFDESGVTFPTRVWFEDLATIINLYPYIERFAYIEKPFYRYLQRSGSIMHNSDVKRNEEIIGASYSVLNFYREKGFMEKYKNEVTHLVILNAYMVASVRVIKSKGSYDILRNIKAFIEKELPNYRENPYFSTLSKKEKLIIDFLDKGQYGLLKTLLKVKEILSK